MSESERLTELINYLRTSVPELSRVLNLTNKTRIYNILQGRNGISKDLANKITEKYTEISYNWLIDGTGSMLKNEVQDEAAEYLLENKNDVSMSREVFNVINNLSETVKSQQALIAGFLEASKTKNRATDNHNEKL